MDDPNITQPVLYKKIKSHPTITEIYSKLLVDEGVINIEKIANIKDEHTSNLSKENDIKYDKETSIWPGEFVTDDINYEKGTEKLSIEELTLLNKKIIWS